MISCPFCGSLSVIAHAYVDGPTATARVWCRGCGAAGPSTPKQASDTAACAEAMRLWRDRAPTFSSLQAAS